MRIGTTVAVVILGLMLVPACGDGELLDRDLDGFPAAYDCNDLDPATFPGALETADDGVDQDCNGTDSVECFYDGDGDGFGWTASWPDDDGDCSDDPEQTDNALDCDDSRDWIHPGAVDEPGDQIDADCSGADTVLCGVDSDGDGWGDAATLVPDPDGDCSDPGQSDELGDCDDDDPDIHPGVEEIPGDGIDQNCSGADTVECYYDGDGDGYGWPVPHEDEDGDCSGPEQSPVGTDCDDSRDWIHPGAVEIVGDGYDQDCNGADTVVCFEDGDGDGWGAVEVLDPDGECEEEGQAAEPGDCNDFDSAVHPEAEEIPGDGIDQDCSGSDSVECYFDGDGDGFGWSGTMISDDEDCDDAYEAYVGTDCNDAAGSVYPGAPEVAGDGIDQDCDGTAD